MLPMLWFLPLAAALAGPKPTPPVTTLSGHLDHAPAGDSVRLIVGFRNVSTALSPSGDFRVVLKDVKDGLPTRFGYGGQRTELYLMPGDQLVMHLDFKDFDKTLTYSGRGSVVNNYLAQSLYKYAYGPSSGMVRPQDFPKGTPAQIQQEVTALRQARREYLANYAKAHPLPAEFVRHEQMAFTSDWVIQQLGYAFQHGAEPLPANYFAFMAEAPMKELDQLRQHSFFDNSLLANMVMGYGYRLVPSGKLSADPAEGPRLYQLATQELGEGRARDWAMEFLLWRNMRGNLPGTQAFYRTFRLHNQDSSVARSARESFAKQALMQPGQPAPSFTLTDNTGKQVSLSDFKGKVVYLDFWGTWCGPCMREMTEFAPALKKQFEGREVVFLYVSVGDPEAKWKQTLVDKQFTSVNSVHLRALDSKVAEAYQVDGYPSYYLIGRDGQLVQPYTSRPSDGSKTVAAIEAALK